MQWYQAALKNYAGFRGRARPKEYWMFVLFNAIAAFLVNFLGIALMIFGLATGAGEPWMWGLSWPALYVLFALGTLLPGLAVTVRRLHDTGRSGLWTLMLLVPFGAIVILVFTVQDGEPHENRYGPNPAPPRLYPYPYPYQPYPHPQPLP